MGGGAVEYDGDCCCIRLWRHTDMQTKRAGSQALVAAAQMYRVAERGNECIPRIVRLAHRYRNLARAEFTSRFEPINFINSRSV